MLLDEILYDGKSDTEASRAVARFVFALPETFEDMGLFVFRYPAPRVRDLECREPVSSGTLDGYAQTYFSSGRSEFECVGNQVVKDFFYLVAVEVHLKYRDGGKEFILDISGLGHEFELPECFSGKRNDISPF